jgi:hypothetical protein
VRLRDRLQLAYNSCARYVFGICRSDEHISGYSARILGLPLGMLPDVQDSVHLKA